MYVLVMQERLAQQQKTMAEERAYLKEIISRMDTQISEQQRQLEKVRVKRIPAFLAFTGTTNASFPKDWRHFCIPQERWKMTAEQAKAESTQRALEEERRTLSMQITMEREELERAKVRMTSADRKEKAHSDSTFLPPFPQSALLEEQKSVMQRCAEERRKLAADWAHFHAQEKQRHERAEREASSLLEKREGSILSLAQVSFTV